MACALLLVDEAPAAGGQVWRAPPAGFERRKADVDARAGDRLRAALAASGVRLAFEHCVWLITEGFRIEAVGPAGPVTWRTPSIVAATGASERVVPFPGWTEPGVIGLAGATILLKAQGVLPGERALVAGCGPLLAAVAAGVLKAGGAIEAIVDLASRREWLAVLPAMLTRPDLLGRGLGWLARLCSAGVPVYHRHTLRRLVRTDGGLRATIAPVEDSGAFVSGASGREFEVDWVAVGHGLVPGTEVARLLGAEHRYEHQRGGWIAVRDEFGRTSVKGLLVAGDGGGIRGAAAAVEEGRFAGLAVAYDQGRLNDAAFAGAARPIRRRMRRAVRFGVASARLMALRPGQVRSIPGETLVCRCEDVTRRRGGDALSTPGRGRGEPAQGLDALRHGAVPGADVRRDSGRAGRGRERLARGRGVLDRPGSAAPGSLDVLLGDYAYADMPLPRAAPL